MAAIEGFLNLLKPPGMTSHDVVAWVRRRLPRKTKVGHLGTLDPAATGVLPLAVGGATRWIQYLPPAVKGYRALVALGVETDTWDTTGKVLRTSAVPAFEQPELEAALAPFAGTIMQRPPAVSAIRTQGRRSYERVRSGEQLEMEPRPAHYHEVRLVGHRAGHLTVDIVCGPGTYVRSLVHELGQALGCGAALAFLIRTQSGPFRLSESVTLEELLSVSPGELVTGVEEMFKHLPRPSFRGRATQKGDRVVLQGSYGEGELVWVGQGLAQVTPQGDARLLAVTVGT